MGGYRALSTIEIGVAKFFERDEWLAVQIEDTPVIGEVMEVPLIV